MGKPVSETVTGEGLTIQAATACEVGLAGEDLNLLLIPSTVTVRPQTDTLHATTPVSWGNEFTEMIITRAGS